MAAPLFVLRSRGRLPGAARSAPGDLGGVAGRLLPVGMTGVTSRRAPPFEESKSETTRWRSSNGCEESYGRNEDRSAAGGDPKRADAGGAAPGLGAVRAGPGSDRAGPAAPRAAECRGGSGTA